MAAILPAEVIELIIHEAWKLPLTNKDRLAFMKTSLCISSQWLFAFLRESLTDIYFVSPSYSYYLTIPYRYPQQPPRILTINATQFSLHDYLVRHCRSITIGPTFGTVMRANFIVRNITRCPMITMLFENYAQGYPSWLYIQIQGLFINAHKDGHLRLIFTYDTTDIDYSPRDRYAYASEQHFYHADKTRKPCRCRPFTGVRTLEMKGANPCAVFLTVEACPDLEVLETDVDKSKIQAGFDVANARPPASCPEEAYFFSTDNRHYPTEEMRWPNRRRRPSQRRSVLQLDLPISGAEGCTSTRIIRERKSIRPSENVLPRNGTSPPAGGDDHTKKTSFAHRMRAFLRIFCLVMSFGPLSTTLENSQRNSTGFLKLESIALRKERRWKDLSESHEKHGDVMHAQTKGLIHMQKRLPVKSEQRINQTVCV
ncbi:uncharacterized protein EV420DRAFT_1646659 [Desarmillaria tabescens]|uniref:Uncharacterized protein n=1 Tax=Armillaria tabescens TaxID=1929756 RepID=A0AA39JWY1_ARMTA|nr:uncharacterized protein EV420DRAFT_1646659 [Desarmillaria tabescens]KAK0450430.1 hypothetical protein EV420DRAFT_1646659 [Desarmillaria tabescens]